MKSNKRTILLGGVLATILTLGMGRPVFVQPIQDAERGLANAKRDLEDAGADNMKLQLARKRLDDAKAASLPPSLNDAQRLYLEWITDLTQECNFGLSSVLPGGQQQRSGKYLLVSVVVEAEASLEDFSRFLFQFKQRDLIHRITKLDVNSSSTSGRPRMEFSLTAEGMSVIGSEDKTELAARVPLASRLDSKSIRMTVGNTESFPSKIPFIAKVGSETIRVTRIEDKVWTVERAVEGSDAHEHTEATPVRHFPIAWNRRNRRFKDYTSFLEQSLFTKPFVPREYNPQLAGLEDLTIAPGETVAITARVDDYNVGIGELEFVIVDAAEGIRIESGTGKFHWTTADDQGPREYKATILVTQKNNPGFMLKQMVTITVQLSNKPPSLAIADSAVVLLGQGFELVATASDDGELENLTYTLESDGLPDGLAIESATGVLTWNPPMTFAPGLYTVQVKVTDQGDPPGSATTSISFDVKDDDARFTRLTAIVKKDGRPEAWFKNTRTNTQDILHVGDQLDVADIAAEIVEIEARVVILKDDDGFWQLALGNHARDRVLKYAPLKEVSNEATKADNLEE